MNIDDLTIGEAKKLANLFAEKDVQNNTPHPLNGKKVVAVLPHGFIHFGTLNDQKGRYCLTDASNLRYWEKRPGGLPEFARKGPIDGDRIDEIGTVHIEGVLFFYERGSWS